MTPGCLARLVRLRQHSLEIEPRPVGKRNDSHQFPTVLSERIELVLTGSLHLGDVVSHDAIFPSLLLVDKDGRWLHVWLLRNVWNGVLREFAQIGPHETIFRLPRPETQARRPPQRRSRRDATCAKRRLTWNTGIRFTARRSWRCRPSGSAPALRTSGSADYVARFARPNRSGRAGRTSRPWNPLPAWKPHRSCRTRRPGRTLHAERHLERGRFVVAGLHGQLIRAGRERRHRRRQAR